MGLYLVQCPPHRFLIHLADFAGHGARAIGSEGVGELRQRLSYTMRRFVEYNRAGFSGEFINPPFAAFLMRQETFEDEPFRG